MEACRVATSLQSYCLPGISLSEVSQPPRPSGENRAIKVTEREKVCVVTVNMIHYCKHAWPDPVVFLRFRSHGSSGPQLPFVCVKYDSRSVNIYGAQVLRCVPEPRHLLTYNAYKM